MKIQSLSESPNHHQMRNSSQKSVQKKRESSFNNKLPNHTVIIDGISLPTPPQG